jgi:hypothetical protein
VEILLGRANQKIDKTQILTFWNTKNLTIICTKEKIFKYICVQKAAERSNILKIDMYSIK